MKNPQPSTNQDSMQPEVNLRSISSGTNKSFMTIIIGVLLTAIIAGSLVFFWQKSVNEKKINVLKQMISSLEEQISIKKVKVSSQPSLSELDSFVNWQLYTNDKYKFSLNYPSKFISNDCQAKLKNPNPDHLICLNDSTNTERIAGVPDIVVRHIYFNDLQQFEETLINDVVFGGSGHHPKSFKEFEVQKIGQNTFYTIVTGNYEGILGINYYIKNDEYIIVFEVTSSPVAWLQPDYNPDEDSFNKDVVQFLSTFQFN